MNCDQVRTARLEDVPPAETMAKHAAECPSCAALLAADEELRGSIEAWRRSSPPAPEALRERVITAAQRAAAEAPAPAADTTPFRPISLWRSTPVRLLAAAATLVVAALIAPNLTDGPGTAVVSARGGLLVDDALARARAAEREHAAAIATLAAAAEPMLSVTAEAGASPAEAARLRAYRDRLASIDDAIRQVQGFLDTNPGHTSARTMLLAAYMDKTALLGEILAGDSTQERG